MIKRILLSVVGILFFAFIVLWLVGGGMQKIRAAVSHYRDPLQYGSVIDWFFQIGTTTGETFKLPGTPSTYPTVSLPTGVSTTSVGPTTVYQNGSNGGNGY